jgi:threonine/homoserine/homoserine lactone efflux protein
MLEILPLSQAMFVAITAMILAVPCPSNALLAASGASLGFRFSLKLIPAVLFSYLAAILAWGSLLSPLIAFWPPLAFLLRLASLLFLAFMAVRMWSTDASPLATDKLIKTTRQVTLATLFNPKALLFAAFLFPPTAYSQQDIFASTAQTFAEPLVPITLAWICFGSTFGKAHRWISSKTVHRTAAIFLASFAAIIGYSVVN